MIWIATNTLVEWQPKQWHETTLSTKGPNNQSTEPWQSGLRIVTPTHLPKLWEKYFNGQMSLREAEEALEEDDVEYE